MPNKPLDLIVAYDKNNGIGKDNSIPWRLPADLKRFAKITSTTLDPEKQNAVIMGRKTWESIPDKFRPLPNRLNLVLTLGHAEYPGATAVHSFHGALKIVADTPTIERAFVIGGAEVYKRAMSHADGIYVTALTGEFDCDVFFPKMREDFALREWDEPHHHAGIDFAYLYYRRIVQD